MRASGATGALGPPGVAGFASTITAVTVNGIADVTPRTLTATCPQQWFAVASGFTTTADTPVLFSGRTENGLGWTAPFVGSDGIALVGVHVYCAQISEPTYDDAPGTHTFRGHRRDSVRVGGRLAASACGSGAMAYQPSGRSGVCGLTSTVPSSCTRTTCQ